MSHLVIKVINILEHLFNTWFRDFYSLSVLNKEPILSFDESSRIENNHQKRFYQETLDKFERSIGKIALYSLQKLLVIRLAKEKPEEFDKVWKNRDLKAMDGNADNYRELGEIYDQFEHRFNSQDGSKNMHVERELYQLANILLMYGS
tara:strand:- start:67 stop:510 length:444 start_codon:yes stop_codon:yes gene_type:complete